MTTEEKLARLEVEYDMLKEKYDLLLEDLKLKDYIVRKYMRLVAIIEGEE